MSGLPSPQVLPGLQRWLPCFQELDDRRKFLEALSEKYTMSGIPEPGPMAELPPLPEEEAILVIQVGVLQQQGRSVGCHLLCQHALITGLKTSMLHCVTAKAQQRL